MLQILLRWMPRSVRRRLAHLLPDARLAFSQEGEDILLQRCFDDRRDGFFVDVGAHHPTRFSNTYVFYLRGWRGINIDAMPGSMAAFARTRPGDVNLETAISDREEDLTYHMFNKTALNTFSEEEAARKDGLGAYRVVEKRILRTTTLTRVLDEHLPRGRAIDFLTVDVEGMDLRVLRSLDWTRYRPAIVLVEELAANDHPGETEGFMSGIGYVLFAKTLNTQFYRPSA